jgi:hypothetical protein
MKRLRSINLSPLQKALLFILPALYFIAGSYFRNLLGNLSLRSCDPEYIYFMSGLTLSDGAIKLGHFDNPGTPLQILVALVFKLTYLFRSPAIPYVEDVFLHPDMYLSVTSLFLVAITAGLIFYAGYKVLQSTKSVFYAVLVQTAPFLPVIWYDLIGRVAPELMMPFPVILLTVLLIHIYFRKEEYTWKSVLLLAFFSAFGLSIKLTFLPLWFLPLIVIEGWKKKLIFVGSAFLMFFIIAFPMTLQFHFFWGWVKNLFMHSGTYGAGDSNVIDFASLKTNLQELYGYEKRYFYVFFGLIGVSMVYLAWFRKKVEKRIVILALALIISISLQIVMVGKHYAHRYFIPVLMLSPLMVFTIAEILKKFYPKKITRYAINTGIVFILIWNVQFHRQWLPIKTNALETEMENRRATWHAAQSLDKDCYKIIASQNYGAPFIEYTLFYSMVWGNHKKQEEYKPILNRLYPNAYSHFTWDNSMKYWGEKFNVQRIIESEKKTFLYLERNEEELYNRTITRLIEEDGSPFFANRELIYLNPNTTEIIYQLTFSKTDTIKSEEVVMTEN